MIEINGKQYYSRYKPADKSWFKMMIKTDSAINKIPFDEKLWEEKWELDSVWQEAKGILEDHPELEKELKLIISECEYRLLKFNEDTDLRDAFQELEQHEPRTRIQKLA